MFVTVKSYRLGLGVSVANQRLTRELNVNGVLILNVKPGSTADKADIRGTKQVWEGLILGDIIQAVNGKEIKGYNTLRDEIKRCQVGKFVNLTLNHDNSRIEVPVCLEAQ